MKPGDFDKSALNYYYSYFVWFRLLIIILKFKLLLYHMFKNDGWGLTLDLKLLSCLKIKLNIDLLLDIFRNTTVQI